MADVQAHSAQRNPGYLRHDYRWRFACKVSPHGTRCQPRGVSVEQAERHPLALRTVLVPELESLDNDVGIHLSDVC